MIIYADGACRGNPGPAAIGVVLADGQGKTLDTLSRRIGIATNNQAEYWALIAGLELAAKVEASELEVRLDSELLVRQLCGRYRVKSAGLVPLYREVMRLLRHFSSAKVVHVPREQNRAADALANKALDEAG
ncbi:MAG: ribonuclease HI family protein [Chloroflexi bacterium]|nr:ribonuclease HI family protein [Chloroflexota bacterium]